MTSNGIAVRTNGLRTIIRVDGWPSKKGTASYGLRIYTSDDVPSNAAMGTFAPPDGAAISSRGSRGGAEKGRILWAVQWANFKMFQVGALLLHVPRLSRRPLTVIRTMVAEELLDSEVERVRAALLACAKQCAGGLGRNSGTLDWEMPVAQRPTVCARYPEFTPLRERRAKAVLRWT